MENTCPRMPVRILTAMPADTNPHGDIFGGWLMSQMDLAAGAVAARRADGGRCVTVAVEGFKFLAPVKVGDEVIIYVDIEREGTSSITMKVCTYSKTSCAGAPVKVCEAVYIFVHIGENGRPVPLPPKV
jgi:acyl-CoA thioesterase YciA